MVETDDRVTLRVGGELMGEFLSWAEEKGWPYQSLMKSVLQWGIENREKMQLRFPKRRNGVRGGRKLVAELSTQMARKGKPLMTGRQLEEIEVERRVVSVDEEIPEL